MSQCLRGEFASVRPLFRVCASGLACVVGLLSVASIAAEPGAAPPALVIRDATLFDSLAGETLPHRTVVVEGERIAAVRAADEAFERPPGAVEIDGRGKFLLPGLIDAHVHLVHVLNFENVTGEEVLPLFLAAGVTSVRDTGDELTAQTRVAQYAEAHPERSPRVYLCSPLIDADPPIHADIGFAVTDPAAVPELVAGWAAAGVTTLKIYAGTPRDVGRRVIEEGHRHGLAVTAHLGPYAPLDAAADGIDCLEHIWSVFNYIVPPEVSGRADHRATLDLDNPLAQALLADLAERQVMVDPTLAVFRNMILLSDRPAVLEHPDNGLVPERLRKAWRDYLARLGLPNADLPLELRQGEFAKYQELTGRLYRAGVPLLAGTDTPEPYVPPGFALHQELEMLVESGLPPSAALQAATINNARALLQHEHLGSVEPGKRADLVLLDADPLVDIRNSRRIVAVVRGGIVCHPAELLMLVPKE